MRLVIPGMKKCGHCGLFQLNLVKVDGREYLYDCKNCHARYEEIREQSK